MSRNVQTDAMSQPPTIHSRNVSRQMDHFILALKADRKRRPEPGGHAGTRALRAQPAAEPPRRSDRDHERPDVLVSLYWIGYTVELGAPTSGHVAYVWGPGDDGVEAVLTDNLELATSLGPKLRPGQWPLRDPDRPPAMATFERRMLQPYGFGYRIRSDGLEVDARWEDLDTPSFASGPTRLRDAWITTMLVESLRPSVTFNGVAQPGASFPNPIWTPWFGDERGSCVIGLGETIYETGASGIATD
jgi:hypothetical protein